MSESDIYANAGRVLFAITTQVPRSGKASMWFSEQSLAFVFEYTDSGLTDTLCISPRMLADTDLTQVACGEAVDRFTKLFCGRQYST